MCIYENIDYFLIFINVESSDLQIYRHINKYFNSQHKTLMFESVFDPGVIYQSHS